MGMVLNEAPEVPIERPPGFPVCNHFYDDHSRDIDYMVKDQKEGGAFSSIVYSAHWSLLDIQKNMFSG